MRIIEIKSLKNGGHRNQNGTLSKVPEGWAMIPDNMDIPSTFPFVEIEVEDGVVVSMTEGVVPKEPEREEVYEPTAQDDTDSMLVDHEYRITMLELGVMA